MYEPAIYNIYFNNIIKALFPDKYVHKREIYNKLLHKFIKIYQALCKIKLVKIADKR
jgi:hypothetical protein